MIMPTLSEILSSKGYKNVPKDSTNKDVSSTSSTIPTVGLSKLAKETRGKEDEEDIILVDSYDLTKDRIETVESLDVKYKKEYWRLDNEKRLFVEFVKYNMTHPNIDHESFEIVVRYMTPSWLALYRTMIGIKPFFG